MSAPVAIWTLRIILALAFLFFGLIKFPAGDGSLWVHIFNLIGIGQWFRYFTGAVEAVGGLMLLVPRATPIAVALLAPTMVGALLTHVLLVGLQPASVVVLILLAAVLVIGWNQRAEQLGLRLVSTKGPVEVIVIDSAKRPTAN
jgi:putative oxidoreductase